MKHTAWGYDPMAFSLIFFQCKHMSQSGILHVDPWAWLRKIFFDTGEDKYIIP